MANSAVSVHERGKEDKEDIRVPAGHRFVPSSCQFIQYYLRNKILDLSLPCNLIKEINLLQEQDPELLPINESQYFRDNEAYFFTQTKGRDITTSRTRLTTKSKNGYWETTDKDVDVPIFEFGHIVGFRANYAYYLGNGPTGEKTPWTMSEYRVNTVIIPVDALNDNIRTKIDQYVGCRIRYNEPKQESAGVEQDD